MTPKKNTNSLSKNQNQLTNQVIRFLGIRPRSQSEILTYLERKTSNQEHIQAVLSTLEDLNLIDDTKFCYWFVESRLHQKPRGPGIIRYELKRFQISESIIHSALSQIDDSDWLQAAATLLRKHTYQLSKLPANKLKYKAYQYLYSKGFPGEIITAAIDEYTCQE